MRLTRQRFLLAMGTCTVILFAALFVHVFGLSGESGSNFAPYSTYRSDPLGMMAVYNALGALPDTDVARYIQDFDQLPNGSGATLVIAGTSLGPDPVPVLEYLEGFAATGGRVVIAFFPIQNDATLDDLDDFIRERDDKAGEDVEKPSPEGEKTDPAPPPEPQEEAAADTLPEPEKSESDPLDGPADTEKEKGEDEEEEAGMDFGPPLQDISERWDFDYGFERSGPKPMLARLDDALPFQPTFEGRSGLYFIPADEKWKLIYGKEQPDGAPARAGVMERRIGSGSVVLCSDAFFLSNEAMREHRDPEFLAWIFGGRRTMLFSEAHLGTQQQDRIMTLVRRYRLHGVLFGLVLVGALFVWRHAATLIPRQEPPARMAPATHAERSHQDGLDNLLARFIPRAQLLDTCVREWSQQFHNDPKGPAVRRLIETRQGASKHPGGEAELVAAYNEISREIHRQSWPGGQPPPDGKGPLR